MGSGSKHCNAFFIPALSFHVTYEFIPFYLNAALQVSVT